MLKYTIRYKLMTKARPRFDSRSGRAYHDNDYTHWLETVAAKIKKLNDKPVGKFFCIYYNFHLKNNRVLDADNLVGALQDAIVYAGIIPNDDRRHIARYWVECQTDSSEYVTFYFCRNVWDFLLVFGKCHYIPELLQLANTLKRLYLNKK